MCGDANNLVLGFSYPTHNHMINRELTYTAHVPANLIEVLDLALPWGMDDDHCGPDDGKETANLSVEV